MQDANQKDRLLKLYGDNYENHLKGANYLLVANGAGFVGCLSLLKDYAASSQYKGTGIFIVLFGIGLLSGIVYYISLAFSRATALNAVMDGVEPNHSWAAFLLSINVPSLLISIVMLIIAIVALMFRFSGL
jgi:hypothetical protein